MILKGHQKGQQRANRGPLTKKERTKECKNDDNAREANAERIESDQQASSSLNFSSLEEAEKDSLWPQFENYCSSNGGGPTLKGWNTWRPKQSAKEAKPRLASMKPRDLQSLRHELLEERKGKLSDARRAATRKQLEAIKKILKGRGIEYAASL
jgi:hypothetical protein